MLDLIKKTMLTGIGLALLAKDEVEGLAKELIDKGKMSEKDGKKFLDDLSNRYEEVQKKLENMVEKTVKEFFKKTDIVTTDELKALKKEIRDQLERLQEKEEKAIPDTLEKRVEAYPAMSPKERKRLLNDLEVQMLVYADMMKFEKAAELRDIIADLKK